MRGFWPTLALGCVLGGCNTYDITGRWVGPMPIADGDHCRIRLYADSRFDFACEGSLNPSGQGKWSLEDRRLKLEVSWIQHEGRVLKEKPSDMVFDTVMERNVLALRPPVGEPIRWERRL